jgi:hypothetical protein
MFEAEHRIRRADGSFGLFHSKAVPVQNSGIAPHEYLGMSVQVTDSAAPTKRSASGVPSGAQIRAARGILRWSVRELADASGVSPAIVRRVESYDGTSPSVETNVLALRDALKEAGVEFIWEGDGKPGVAPR